MYNQESEKKDVEQLKDELAKATTEDEIETIKYDIAFFREIAQEEKKEHRYGFAPFLRSSGKRGTFNSWNDPDLGLIPKAPTSKSGVEVDVNDAW